MQSAHRRGLALLGLVALLGGLAVWYGTLAPAPALGAYPGTTELAAKYSQYVGGHAAVGGRVVATTPVTILGETDAGTTVRLTITDLAKTPAVGEELRVFGVVKPNHTIRAVNSFTVPQSGLWYTWTVSFLAGVWTLARIIRYWRLETRTWRLCRRETPLTVSYTGDSKLLELSREENEDA